MRTFILCIITLVPWCAYGQVTCIPGDSTPETLTIDISGANSEDDVGDPGNTSGSECFPSGTTMDVVGDEIADVDIFPTDLPDGSTGPSWCSEATIDIGGAIAYTPAFTEDNVGPCNNGYGNPLFDYAAAGLVFSTDASGCVSWEAYETFNDGAVSPDQTFGSGLITLYGCPTGAVLPVELLSFTAEAKENMNMNMIKWSTSTELNALHFQVQRAVSSSLWQPLGELNAVGNTQEITEYSFEDERPLPRNLYRLKMVDQDGSYKYSDVISVENSSVPTELVLYPNPTPDAFIIQYMDDALSGKWSIHNTSGKLLKSVDIQPGKMVSVRELLPGRYYLTNTLNMVFPFIKE